MKKYIQTAMNLLTSIVLVMSSFSAYAVDEIETGVVDMSGEYLAMDETDGISMNFAESPLIMSASYSDSYFLGDYLDSNNKAVYDAFTELVTPSSDNITITLPEPVVFTTSSKELSASDRNLYNAIFGSCSSGIAAVLFDMPEIFWIEQNKIVVSPNKIKYTYDNRTKLYTYTIRNLTITPAYYSGFNDFDEIFEYKQKLEQAVDEFEVIGDTTSEKLRYIHDKIAEFTYFDSSADFSGSALSSLVTKGSVCEGYSKGFKLICDKLDIPCVCIFGNYNSSTQMAHMWNYVLMEDNCWYAVDLTWDDEDGGLKHTYFLKGSGDFNSNHTQFENYLTTNLTYPEIASWNYGENPAFTTTSDENEYEYGDLNHDGKVSVADLVYCSCFVLNSEPVEYSCDVNDDGRVDVFDVIIMRQLIANIIDDIKNSVSH